MSGSKPALFLPKGGLAWLKVHAVHADRDDCLHDESTTVVRECCWQGCLGVWHELLLSLLSKLLAFGNTYARIWGTARRGALTRPELALCLMSELAYEHDEEFRRHLPTLLQVITLNAGGWVCWWLGGCAGWVPRAGCWVVREGGETFHCTSSSHDCRESTLPAWPKVLRSIHSTLNCLACSRLTPHSQQEPGAEVALPLTGQLLGMYASTAVLARWTLSLISLGGDGTPHRPRFASAVLLPCDPLPPWLVCCCSP